MRLSSAIIYKLKVWCKRHLSPRAIEMLRSPYSRHRSRSRARQRENEPILRKQDLIRDLRSAGFKTGDTVMVHSSLASIGRVEGGAITVIESLLDVLTDNGTLIMPCYNSAETFVRELKHSRTLDLRETPSATGKITETFRTYPGVIRSSHPFSSSCALGKKAKYVTEGHALAPEVCHADSPVGRLVAMKGRVVGIGIPIAQGLGVAHYMEDTWEGFPFEVHSPNFTARYIDAEGNHVEREICRFDPQVAQTRIDYPDGKWICEKLTEHLHSKGILRWFKYGRADCWVMQSDILFEELKRLAGKGVTMYLTPDKLTDQNRNIEEW